MPLLKPTIVQKAPPVLVSSPVYLRAGEKKDFESWVALRAASKVHLTRWEEDWGPDDLSYSVYSRRLRLFDRELRRSSGLSLFVFLTGPETGFGKTDEQLVGGVTLTNIRYGASRTATLGYWIGAPFVRQGYASLAIEALLAHAIETIGLNRIEAACQPENHASIALLNKTGFRKEGLGADYLKINGEWRDHLLFAVTARDYEARQKTILR